MFKAEKNKFNSVTVVLTTVIAIFCAPFNCVFAEEYPIIHVIAIKDLKFVSSEINVKPGDIVQWINYDFIPHTVTANDQGWDSGLIDVKKSWKMTINKETFENYFCVYHPSMTGKINMAKEGITKVQ